MKHIEFNFNNRKASKLNSNKRRKSSFSQAFVLGASLLLSSAASARSESAQDYKFDAKARTQVVKAIVSELQQGYVFPDKAKMLAQHFEQASTQASVQKLSKTHEFAHFLTSQLQDKTGDKHLVVEFSEEIMSETGSSEEDVAAREAFEMEMWRAHNFGVEKIERLRFNIGYLKLSAFGPVEEVGPLLASAMSLVNNMDSLIIDLRGNFGGNERTVQLLSSYLLNKRTHLLDMHKPRENRVEQHWSLDYVEGPKFAEDKDVYILVDSESFSAAEDFSYTMKNLKRATLVGEATGGAANSGDMVRLDKHFSLFLPTARGVSPITKTNWEGVGVQPDIKVSSEQALNEAQAAILTKILKAEQDPRRKLRIEARLAELRG